MNKALLPEKPEMIAAFMGGDSSYDGVFYTGVRSTGIFCRPSCPARKPLVKNLEFFATVRDAMFAGYRACKRCHPLQDPYTPEPWLVALTQAVNADPQRRWRDVDLRTRGLNPATVRRCFQKHYGMTFHAYARAQRLGSALSELRNGRGVTDTAFAHGFESLSGFGEALRRLTGTVPCQGSKLVNIRMARLLTPLGPMLAGALDGRLVLLEFADRRALERQLHTLCRRFKALLVPGSEPVLTQVERELEGYFSGRLKRFDTPLHLLGTPFQKRVWSALMRIPFAATCSYQALATRTGNPAAVRAVARANGDNHLAILVPCHRVIGKDGSLTGYGGGLWRKQRLLDLEQGRLQA